MLRGDDSWYALVFNKVFGILINFEATLKFELIKDNVRGFDSIFREEENYIQIYETIQVGACKYGQSLVIDLTCMQVMIDAHSYCNQQLDIH